MAGMTGTAQTEAAEFSNIYGLEVTEVPTNKPLSRTDNSDVVFRSEAGTPVHLQSHCLSYMVSSNSSYQSIQIVRRMACAGKWAAAVTEIRLYSKQGRPVLVGTTSVERSEALAAMLKQEGDA